MKNIFFNGRFLTQPITGVQRTAYELMLALDQLLEEKFIDIEKYSFTLIYSGELLNPINLRHIRLVKKGFLSGNLWEQLELPFYTAGSLLISMCTISSLFKRKQIVIVHDASFIVNPKFFPPAIRLWYQFAIRLLGKTARHLITVSNFSKHELITHIGFTDKKTSVIYNAADHILRFNEPAAAFINKINSLKPYCLAVSSLSENKNFPRLAQAISNINFEGFNMLIAGGVMPTLQETTQELNVNYLGYVTNEELKYLYANASLFLFPSLYEGFGIPPLEAMISGCPVISSNTSSLPEILGDACCYIDPLNVNDMAEKIGSLLLNPEELNKLTVRGLYQAAKYNWKKSAEALFAIAITHV